MDFSQDFLLAHSDINSSLNNYLHKLCYLLLFTGYFMLPLNYFIESNLTCSNALMSLIMLLCLQKQVYKYFVFRKSYFNIFTVKLIKNLLQKIQLD